jgi:hypothetical protein
MPNKISISDFFNEVHDIVKNNLKKPPKFTSEYNPLCIE